jgi:hypothetical protein
LLTDNRGEAVRLLGESLAWIRQRGSLLAQMAPIIAEDGAVLAHLGEHRTLAQIVDGFEQLGELPPTVTDALTYLRSTGLRAADAVAPRDATAADSWVLATLHALTDAGGTDPAIADQVRERLMAFDQRRPQEHPLMTPGRALAWSLVR